MRGSDITNTEQKEQLFIPHGDDSSLGEHHRAGPALGPGQLGEHHPGHAGLDQHTNYTLGTLDEY